MRPEPSSRQGFGKRGRVELKGSPGTSGNTPAEPASASSIPAAELAKWAGGGIAAVVLLTAATGGTGGGGGFLAGMLGGLAANQLAKRPPGPAHATAPASQPGAQAATVQRGGFGSTGGGGGNSSSGGG